MSKSITEHCLPAIGDILLLVSKNKLRKPNTAYQSIVRRRAANYSHVAVVFSPYSIIDGTPTAGVSIRQWDAISKHYNLEKSIVLRHCKLASSYDMQEHILSRMQYYYAQPYSLTSLFSKQRKFRDREGLVCSQFVAAVFEDIGIPSSSNEPRKTLPIDIDVHTRRTKGWSRFVLSNYLLGCSSGGIDSDSVTAELQNSLSTLDEYYSKSTIDNISMSKAGLLLNTVAQLVVTEIESEKISDEGMAKLLNMYDRGEFRISADDFIFLWRRFFAEPELPPQFLHEESFDHRGIQKCFIASCKKLQDYVDETSPKQDDLIYKGMDQLSTLFTLLTERINGGLYYTDVLDVLIKVRENINQVVELKDKVFACIEPESIERRIEGYPDLLIELQNNPKADINDACKCLKSIWFFDISNKQWIDLRRITLHYIEQIDSLVAMANSN